jgi:hypothetical protein
VASYFSRLLTPSPLASSLLYHDQDYAPSVPVNLLRLLVAAFSDLRRMVEEGSLLYPYSTRELVNIVRHLSK